ncbi:hypothetical protein LOTGIDRAFT_176533, partial [Lottia gigantea]
KQFGYLELFTCHCTNDNDCNSDGSCQSNGCARGWYGSTCQKQNVALGKPASQVSQYDKFGPELAVDGDRSQNYYRCTNTGYNNNSWWSVNLIDTYPIRQIHILYRRGDYLTYPGDTDNSTDECFISSDCTQGKYNIVSTVYNNINSRYYIDGCQPGFISIDCTQGKYNIVSIVYNNINGRYYIDGCQPGFISIDCTQGFISIDCTQGKFNIVSTVYNNVNVRYHIDGCQPGFISTDCTHGKYNTVNTAYNNINGRYYNDGCKPGFISIDCTQECPEASYGKECSKMCTDRNCLQSQTCDSMNGTCVDGCKPGFISIDCTQGFISIDCTQGKYNIMSTVYNNINDRYYIDCCKPGFISTDCKQDKYNI